MSKIIRIIFGVLAVVFLIGASLSSASNPGQAGGASQKDVQKKLNKDIPGGVTVASNGNITKVITDLDHAPLQDNLDLYKSDDPGSLVTMYVTIRRGNDLDDTNHSWSEVNNATKFFFANMEHVIVPKAEAILQIGDENGPLPGELGYGAMVTNATIQIRGSRTSLQPQKSYKIELFQNAGAWRGQHTIALNKHPTDPTRVRNKLSFDLMKTIPNLISLRTQFVHLYVKDETADPQSKVFEDYGLFTQIELPNQRFLRNHLLDRYGQLYKTVMFEFYRYPDQLRLADDPLYNEEAFSSVLEIKGNKDHTKLLQMLDDVNNWAIPIEQTFEKYFNEENYFTWMAFNILVANVDTNAQNFYLYSPQNSQKWYFIPWDYDGTFARDFQVGAQFSQYQTGLSNYWGVVLHRRVLMVPAYQEKLDDKIHELLDYMTPELINNMLNVYRPVTDQYVTRMPDILHLPVSLKNYDLAYSLMPDEPKVNYRFYQEALEKPMPFFLGTPENLKDTGKFRFSWEEAYDFHAEDISYHFMVATDWEFQNVIRDATLTNINQIEVPKLDPGTYFWRVLATNERGKTEGPFDYYMDSNQEPHFGVKYLYISTDGEILERQWEQP